MLRVLFICTGNSARSILAEAAMNHLHGAHGFTAMSAGSHPTGVVNPLALEVLSAHHIPTDGLRSKNWDEFSGEEVKSIDFVFTVCDNAAGEVCPIWPGQPITAHWGVPDPAAVQGTDELKRRAFEDALGTLKRRINLFCARPIEALSRMSLQDEVSKIGRER